MEYSPELQQSIIPNAEEKKQLKKHYFKLAWIIIALVAVFTFINKAVLIIAAGILGGGFDTDSITAGRVMISQTPVMKAIYSYGFPIAADIAALGIGLIVTKSDLRKKITLKGFSGMDFFKFLMLSFGVVTIGSLINMIILAIVTAIFGDFSDIASNSTSAIISTSGNPLWLQILIYLYICLLGPILEELIFRGVLLEGLRKYGNAFGIIMSSVLFGLMHQNFMQCIPAAVMGIVWAAMAVKSGSLIPSMIAHIINNSLSAILMIMISSSSILDFGKISSMTDVSAMMNALSDMIPLLIAVYANAFIRFICIIASVIMIIRFRSDKRVLFERSLYCRERTWKYMFTSIPWLIVMGYLLYSTITSIPI